MAIRKQGNKFIVTSSSGRKLGEHRTRAKAVKQLQAIEASKARRAKGKRK